MTAPAVKFVDVPPAARGRALVTSASASGLPVGAADDPLAPRQHPD